MILMIGGAFQGKLEYAKQIYHLSKEDVFGCNNINIDFSKKCINHIEEFCFACIQNNIEPLQYFKQKKQQWQNSILICNDIFCGVVPIETDLRKWRQSTANLCSYLSQNAKQVSRIFCGLEQRLK